MAERLIYTFFQIRMKYSLVLLKAKYKATFNPSWLNLACHGTLHYTIPYYICFSGDESPSRQTVPKVSVHIPSQRSQVSPLRSKYFKNVSCA